MSEDQKPHDHNDAVDGGQHHDDEIQSTGNIATTPGAQPAEKEKETQDEPEANNKAQEEADEEAREEEYRKQRRERDARAQALTLEIIGDLPSAEVKPPENVLFVCKLNPITQDEDLQLIFSRFGKILSCEVIRDKQTGDSLQYAFIEFENQKECEQAYFKMQGVLIDDHRIHVDFSQSVSRLSDTWRKSTNSKRATHLKSQQRAGGGFGGVSELERRRQYRAAVPDRPEGHRYGMVIDEKAVVEGQDERKRQIQDPPSRQRASPVPSRRNRDRGYGRSPSRSISPDSRRRRRRSPSYERSSHRRNQYRSRSQSRERDDRRQRRGPRHRYRDER